MGAAATKARTYSKTSLPRRCVEGTILRRLISFDLSTALGSQHVKFLYILHRQEFADGGEDDDQPQRQNRKGKNKGKGKSGKGGKKGGKRGRQSNQNRALDEDDFDFGPVAGLDSLCPPTPSNARARWC
eukprot:SAG22_NODE_2039_length_3097_cov_4.879586_1_plen_129_part_00